MISHMPGKKPYWKGLLSDLLYQLMQKNLPILSWIFLALQLLLASSPFLSHVPRPIEIPVSKKVNQVDDYILFRNLKEVLHRQFKKKSLTRTWIFYRGCFRKAPNILRPFEKDIIKNIPDRKK